MAFMFNEHTPKKIVFNGHNVSKLIFNGNLVFGGEGGITINCYDVETELLLQTIKLETPADGVLYFNNNNAPIVDGYDFVVMDGVKHIGVVDGDSFNVWYVSQSVPDRTKTNWNYYYRNNTEIVEIIANTYSATSMSLLCNGCSSLKRLRPINTSNVTNMGGMFRACSILEAPIMDTSNVTNMNGTFYMSSSLVYVPPLNTSKVKDFTNMFNYCTKLTVLDWEIDMSNCTVCTNMFTRCPAKNIKLKNVPTSLDLSQIGTTNYTVINYI